MSNRMMMGTNVVLVIAVVVIGFVAISSMQQNRLATDALRVQLAQIAERREQQSDLADWAKVNVRVTPVSGHESSGLSVTLRGEAAGREVLTCKSCGRVLCLVEMFREESEA